MNAYNRSVIAAMSVFLILDTLAIAARIYVRTLLIRGFGWDDATLCLAFLGYIIACAMGFTSIYYGFAADGDVSGKMHYNAAKAEVFYFANQLSLYISSGIVKIAVALVLYRLATNVRLQAILITSMIVVAVWTFVTTLFSSWLCASSGASDYIGSSTCTAVGYFRMISNIFIDYFFALFPITMLWNAKMSFRMKLSVCILLGLGMFASAATIAKLAILVELGHAKGKAVDHLHYQLLIWADVELGLAIFCASAAALRPLLRRFSSIWGSANSRTPYGRSTEGSISCHPLSMTDPEAGPSAERSVFGGVVVVEEYELSKMDSTKSADHQCQQTPRYRQEQESTV